MQALLNIRLPILDQLRVQATNDLDCGVNVQWAAGVSSLKHASSIAVPKPERFRHSALTLVIATLSSAKLSANIEAVLVS